MSLFDLPNTVAGGYIHLMRRKTIGKEKLSKIMCGQNKSAAEKENTNKNRMRNNCITFFEISNRILLLVWILL